MKNLLIEAYNNLPKFSPAQRLQEVQKLHRNAYVTEAIDNEKVDVLVDKVGKELKIKVDGKGRGAEWKYWKDHFEATVSTEQVLTSIPFDYAIIRCSTNRNPTFMKVLGVLSIDPVSHATRWIPFKMIEIFCKSVGMSPMPIVLRGAMNIPQIKAMVDKPILGVKRSGVYVIPDGTPTEYIFLPVNVDEKEISNEIENNSILQTLAEEFAIRAIDEAKIKSGIDQSKTKSDVLKECMAMATRDLLTIEYVERLEKEAGAKNDKARNTLQEAAAARADRLWEHYA